MSSPEWTESDNSFEVKEILTEDEQSTIILTSDDSDEDTELPKVELQKKKIEVIKRLFPTKKIKESFPPLSRPVASISSWDQYRKTKVPVLRPVGNDVPSTSNLSSKPKAPIFQLMMEGVKVTLPVDPYGSQKALMSKVITAIKKGKNCLLESPTGSGKTLALLCGALAWQQHEINRLSQERAQTLAQCHSELNGLEGAVDYIKTPVKKVNVTPEKLFERPQFGEKSIYGKSLLDGADGDGRNNSKRPELSKCWSHESPSEDGLVQIHKKRRIDNTASPYNTSPELPSTPEPTPRKAEAETPPHVSIPIIYYGARTHKQLQQVIKEFRRTSYCGETEMSLLSSREYSCLRDFDRTVYKSKIDMCRECTKPVRKDKMQRATETNCGFYDNRAALNRKVLPPAFDLEDLVKTGEEIKACPYYAARILTQDANIIFCPYNYLIDPGIRSSLSINLDNNVVIIDEAHNIEDICRDAGTCTITSEQILNAIKELEGAAKYQYSHSEAATQIEYLLKTLLNWNDWFRNQSQLVNNKPINNGEATHTWRQPDHFVQTLDNHSIGVKSFSEFKQNSELLCKKLVEEPDKVRGITQITGNLLESISRVLGFYFRQSCKYLDDFIPVLVKTLEGDENTAPWKFRSYTDNQNSKATYALRLLCMNPAVVFESLKVARSIILASGTLTPTVSLHSELDTDFPLQVSPNHVISADRVWIGTLSTCPGGERLECTNRFTDQVNTQDALGQAVLWMSQVTPNGVLCFVPSYQLMNKLVNRWRESGLWKKLNDLKHVFMESRNVRDHNDVMEDYYKYAVSQKGALLFAVYRGKVSEGMDFKDHQARGVITVGVPYPNTFDIAVLEKQRYNDRYCATRKLLSGREWLRVQAFRALNQAVGRCVRHKYDWGAVLLVDARFTNTYYTEHLSKWVRGFLASNHHTFESLVNSSNSLESFMQNMTLKDKEDEELASL